MVPMLVDYYTLCCCLFIRNTINCFYLVISFFLIDQFLFKIFRAEYSIAINFRYQEISSESRCFLLVTHADYDLSMTTAIISWKKTKQKKITCTAAELGLRHLERLNLGTLWISIKPDKLCSHISYCAKFYKHLPQMNCTILTMCRESALILNYFKVFKWNAIQNNYNR